jgi:hypothetical protein
MSPYKVGKPEAKRPLGRPSVDGGITLKRILNNYDFRGGLDWICLAQYIETRLLEVAGSDIAVH